MPNATTDTVGAEPLSRQQELRARLMEPFECYFTDERGGVNIKYIDGWQCTDRLLEVFGVGGWSFRVPERKIHEEADEIQVLGQLSVRVDGEWVVMEQFGSQKIHRSKPVCGYERKPGEPCGQVENKHKGWQDRQPEIKDHPFQSSGKGAPLDIGFDFKGASTDALKKCASLLGIGLYLSRKDGAPIPGRAIPAGNRGGNARDGAARGAQQGQQRQGAAQQQQRPAAAQAAPARQEGGESVIECQGALAGGRTCHKQLLPMRWSDPDKVPGAIKPFVGEKLDWSPLELAQQTSVRFHKPLCWDHLAVAVGWEQQRAARDGAVTAAA